MKQPKVLPIFFLTEMWERFGFYTVEALLILFMTHALQYSDANAYAILGEFTALVYISPVVGGYLADNILGFRFAILIGGIFLSIGYAVLAFGSSSLLLGLSLIILGNGLLKPNISSFLGEFYQYDDARREGGFTIFYMGLNIGIFAATLFSGFIKQWFGWGACFALASVGMLIGILTFRLGYRVMEEKGGCPRDTTAHSLVRYLITRPVAWLVMVLAILFIYNLMHASQFTEHLLAFFAVIILTSLTIIAAKQPSAVRRRMLALIILIAASIVFWALFTELFLTVNLFTDRVIIRTFGDFTIPTVAFLSLETLFIIVLGPFLAILWQRAHQINHTFSAPLKFAFAMLLLGIAMQVLAIATHHQNAAGMVSATWLIGFYILVAAGELLLSPIGLAMVTELSPPKYSGLMMGVWFVGLGFGGALSGVLAQHANIPKTMHDIHQFTAIYQETFQYFANIGYVSFVVMLALTPILNKLIRHGG